MKKKRQVQTLKNTTLFTFDLYQTFIEQEP